MFDLSLIHGLCYKLVHFGEISQDDIETFSISNPKGYGLERYFKSYAQKEEATNLSRTYVVIDTTVNNMVVGFFTLRTGLITVSRGLFSGFDTYTGIELANFAVNDLYKEAYNAIPKLGSYIFDEFILPMVQDISTQIGAKYLYIYALPENKLMEHYQTMGFLEMPRKQAKFVYRHVKPAYDKSCIFMWQPIN